jgi:hypothetical protein
MADTTSFKDGIEFRLRVGCGVRAELIKPIGSSSISIGLRLDAKEPSVDCAYVPNRQYNGILRQVALMWQMAYSLVEMAKDGYKFTNAEQTLFDLQLAKLDR